MDTEEEVTKNAAETSDLPDQEGPVAPTLNSTVPVQISELDFMKFQLAREKYQRAQLTHDVCVREAQRAEGDLAHKGHLLGQLTRELAQKHGVDLDAMMVSDDGYFMPRPAQQLPTRR